MEMNIDRILDSIRERQTFQTVARFGYKHTLEECLEVLNAIGRERDPRFVIDDDNRFTYENLLKWVHGDMSCKCLDPVTRQATEADLCKGFYIAGNTGSGKSWCLEILSAYAYGLKYRIKCGSVERPLTWTVTRADDITDYYAKNGNLQMQKCDLMLGIQDLGTEAVETLYMGNRLQVMRSLIEYRGDRTDIVTNFTSNYSMNNPKLRERYGDRVISRLKQMCNYYEIKGKDRRL